MSLKLASVSDQIQKCLYFLLYVQCVLLSVLFPMFHPSFYFFCFLMEMLKLQVMSLWKTFHISTVFNVPSSTIWQFCVLRQSQNFKYMLLFVLLIIRIPFFIIYKNDAYWHLLFISYLHRISFEYGIHCILYP